MAKKSRSRKAAKAVAPNQNAWIGAAWMGLVLLLMVAVVGAVYWINPNDNSQNAASGVKSPETTGIGTFKYWRTTDE